MINETAPEGTACSSEVAIVTEVIYKDGRVEHPWDDKLRKQIVIGSDGKPRCPYLEAKSWWNSDKGLRAVRKAISEGKAFPAD
jgi:hypothetical protein